MIKIIDGKRYSTNTAEKVAYWNNGLPESDFNECEEDLYRTKNGNYFLHGRGHAMTMWGTCIGQNSRGRGQGILAFTPDEALEWLEEHGLEVPDGCPEISALVQDA
jgi:hypothetical protein